MILESLITTTDQDGQCHLAPMGPTVDKPDFQSFLIRPYTTSTTFQNLVRTMQGVLHVSDDVLLLAQAAVGQPKNYAVQGAESVQGYVLKNACRAYEFRVSDIESSHNSTESQRITIRAEVVLVHRLRDFFGFNRAKHAVLEAAILATRFRFLPTEQIAEEFKRLRIIVNKTAGEPELQAMNFLEQCFDTYQTEAK